MASQVGYAVRTFIGYNNDDAKRYAQRTQLTTAFNTSLSILQKRLKHQQRPNRRTVIPHTAFLLVDHLC